ncbi:MAG: sugar transferase [Candidatus Woesebacteria bacterium]|jgi:exopolysaccharide biosynthesis polyprenyl glycosylphosphotransferase
MPIRSVKLYSIALIIGDFVTLLAAFVLAYVLRVQFDNRPLLNDVYAIDFLLTSLALIPLWIAVFMTLGLYRSNVYNRRLTEYGKLIEGCLIGILIIIGFAFVFDEPIFPARLVPFYAFLGALLFLLIERESLRQLREVMYRYGRGIRRVLIIGTSDAIADIAANIGDTKKSGYKVVAIASPKKLLPKNYKGRHYSVLNSALKDLEHLKITTIVQTDLYDSSERNQAILHAAQANHIAYSFIPGEPEFYSGKNTVDVFLGYPVISVHQTPLIGWGVIAKRIFDLIATTLIAIILSPLLLIVVILQKILNPGPILFVNKRLGLYAKPFGLYKFRSMSQKYGGDAIKAFQKMGRPDLIEEYKINRKIVNDPRVTPFGKFLRATSIDELPQLINVFKGDISLVGPRPILPDELHFYKGRGALLHSVKPGITGLWQVSGRSDLSFDQRVELELYYAQNWSFWLDIKILFKTISAVFNKSGAR